MRPGLSYCIARGSHGVRCCAMNYYEAGSTALQLLGLLFLVATVAIYYKQLKAMEGAARDGANADRKATTFQILERWNSDLMMKVRNTSFALLNSRYTDNHSPIFLGDVFETFQADGGDPYRSIGILSQFFADLHSLWSEGALDDRLACALFLRPIRFWFQYLRLVDSRKNENDPDPLQLAARANRVRALTVLPIEIALAKAQERTGYSSPFTSEEPDGTDL